MKIFTLLLFCFCALFSAALWAKPISNTFSVPEDTLFLGAPSKAACDDSQAPIPNAATKSESLLPTLLVVGDFCGQGTGFVDLTPDPNTQGPWTFRWATGETTEDLLGLSAGTYTVTVIDANGNEQVTEAVVGDLPSVSPLDIHVVATSNTACNGPFTGALDITVDPLSALWTYEWSSGATTQDATDLASGPHFVTITMGVTCSTVYQFTVPDNSGIPFADIPGHQQSTCSRADGATGVLVFGGVMPYSYIWSNGATASAIQNLLSGTYTVTVSSPNGCTSSASVFVSNFDYIMLIDTSEVIITPNSACIGSNGSIDILHVHSILQGPFTYLWSNGATTQDLYNLPSGTYTVTATIHGFCHTTEEYYIADEPQVPGLTFNNTNTNCGLGNGYVNLTTLSGGMPPYTYLWSNGATTQDLNNVPADTYTVTVTGINGCSITESVVLDDTPLLFDYSALITDHNACDTSNGQINLSLFPSNLTYQWSNGATTKILKNLEPGNYTVTISAGGTCTAVETYNVGDVTEYPSIPAALTASTCGLPNGSIDLTVAGSAEPPFTYQWSNGATTEDLSGILADTFYVTVTSSVGCTKENMVILPNVNDTIRVEGNLADDISCASPTGYISLNVTPLDTNYTYLWSNGMTADSLGSLAAGAYFVTVTLGLTCIALDSFVVANTALPPDLSASGNDTNCDFSNGTVDLSISGGTGPFQFLWSNLATTEDISDLAPGSYTVTVTGANSCTAIHSAMILNNDIPLSVNAVPTGNTSCTLANGSLNISVSPAGAYNYLWSNMATTEDLGNLLDGTYTVTVSLGTCVSTGTFAVADNTASPVISSNITDAICSLNNGGIDLSVSGTAGPFNYLWSNMATTEDLSAVLPGSYSVSVTAPSGCIEVATFNVANGASTFSLAASPAPLTNCAANNGAIDLDVTPVGAFTYLWSNGAVTEDLNGLAPGTYTVSVTESGSCTATASYLVLDQRSSPVSVQTIVPELCGLSDGSIDLSVSGGTLPYGYLWNAGQVSQDLSNLSAGTYTVTLTDANDCSVTSVVVVPGNSIAFSLAGTPSDNSSCLQNNGAVDLSVSPPSSSGFTYLWSNMATTEDLNSLNAGTYTVTVSAGGNCTNTAVFTLLNDVPSPLVSQNVSASFCGQASGGIDLSVSGSPAPYQFLWSNMATTEDLSSIVSNAYSVTVTAANGCTTTGNFAVPENVFTPAIGSQLSASTSCVMSNGAIDLTILPAQAYTFLWSTMATTEDLANLSAGNYTVTVSGGGTCTNTAVLTVGSTVPLPVLSDNIAAATCGQASGSIDVSVTGSPAPYGYLWSNTATTEDLSDLLSGSFTLTVTAANGCTSTGSYTVPENTIAPVINGTPSPASSCLAVIGAIDLTVGPASGYTFLWSNAATTEDLSGIAAGSYTVTVNGGGACVGTASFTVADETTQPQANIVAATTALDCSTTAVALNGNVTGTPNPTSFQWSQSGTPLGTGSSLTVSTSGQYELVVQDNLSFCTATASIGVTQSLDQPNLVIASPAVLTCIAPAQTLAGSSPVAGVQYSWATIIGTDTSIVGSGPSLQVSVGGTYFLLGINPVNNCANAVSVNVLADQNPPTANAGTPFTLDCAGETAPLSGSGSGANSLSYQWTSQDGHLVSGAGTASPLIDEAGTYQLLVTNIANGCTDTDLVTIAAEVPIAFASVVQPTCLDQQGKVLIDSVTGLSGSILYSLNSGAPTAQDQFTNLDPGTYTVLALGSNGCNATVEAVISPSVLLEITLTPVATIALGNTYQIDAQVNIPNADIASVSWTPGADLVCDTCLSTAATPYSTTEYQLLVVSDQGCEARSTLRLIVDRTRHIYVPNIFSPNEDGNNDLFSIYGDPASVVKVKSLQVFSRWGEAVFEHRDFDPSDTQIGWDGTFNGQRMNPAVFVWQAVVLFIDGKEELYKGDVTLKR
jgi:gliding motility-associated-like protein